MPKKVKLVECMVYNYHEYLRCIFDREFLYFRDIAPNTTCKL